MMNFKKALVTAVLIIGCSASAAFGQAGKVAGTVTDAETGNPLPGVNVVIVGTQQGATTNAEGFYNILNVSPGTYDVRASFVGFTPTVHEGVRVNIDLTTEVDFALQEQTEQLEEITVQATEPVVRRDVSANVANLSAEDIEDVPVAGISEVINLQAGVEPGMRIRGGGLGEVNFQVDGLSMRSGRDNTPFTGISYTSVKEVQVQTGGFSAEYGNVRSGLINVVTKEGARDHYSADLLLRYAPTSKKYFGGGPNNSNAYYMRPYLDPDVAFVGTHSEESPWGPHTRRQYPQFGGWNAIATQLESDDDPTNDLTPEQAQDVFEWFHRKSFDIEEPDYTVDASFGGPAPVISDMLGDLRFFASYRQTQSAYIIPQVRDVYRDRVGQLKLTSDVSSNMKLQLQGLYSQERGLNSNNAGFSSMFKGEVPAYPWHSRGMATSLGGEGATFATDVFEPSDISRYQLGAKFTHTLGTNTFYEVQLQRMSTDYSTYLSASPDSSILKSTGSMDLTSAPLGNWQGPRTSPGGFSYGITAWGLDSSEVEIWQGRFDITSQLNPYLQVKSGIEYIYNSYLTRHGAYNPYFINNANPKYRWHRQPRQGAAYAQSKLEFEGMVANLGLRLDYFHAGGDWWEYGPYTEAFSGRFGAYQLDEVLNETPTERQFALSPRLGVSFPITEDSKFYFNYGFFRQMLDPSDIFMVQEVGPADEVGQIGNPNHPLPTTVAYELGYDHNIFDQFLFRFSGYYKDIYNQPRYVGYHSLGGDVDYSVALPNNYEDIRGFEISLRKNKGEWIRGFANYSYMVTKGGNFGFGNYYENRADQRQYERNSRAHYQNTPVPEPYAHVNLEFYTPSDFGPALFGGDVLGDWRLSLLGEWRAGDAFTWSGGQSFSGLENNVRWKDYWMLDLRLTKNFNISEQDIQLFADVSNVLNLKQMHQGAGFYGNRDFETYMQSLHLPEEIFSDIEEEPYPLIAGEDEPGDYREPETPYVPIEIVNAVNGVDSPSQKPLYFEQNADGEEGTYMWYRNDTWQEASQDFVEAVLENKQYIDMPNQSYLSFLNPRRVLFGIRISL